MDIRATFDALANKHRLFRRVVLLWAVLLVSYVVVQTMQPEILLHLPPPAATVIVAFVGILATVIAFYQWHRNANDTRRPD